MKNKAFTLIEVMVVVAIIGILAAVLVPQVGKMIDKGKVARAKGDVRSIANAILEFHNDTGTWPKASTGSAGCSSWNADKLTTISDGAPLKGDYYSTEGWDGPYLDKDIPTEDPWGNPYYYGEFFDELPDGVTVCGDHYSIIASKGPNKDWDVGTETTDRTVGGDDIVIWLE